MLVRRAAFERVGGFDTGFVNSLEDVDLCLRIGEAGGEVHYCHEAVRHPPRVGLARSPATASSAASTSTASAGASGSAATTSPSTPRTACSRSSTPTSYPLRLSISPRAGERRRRSRGRDRAAAGVLRPPGLRPARRGGAPDRAGGGWPDSGRRGAGRAQRRRRRRLRPPRLRCARPHRLEAGERCSSLRGRAASRPRSSRRHAARLPAAWSNRSGPRSPERCPAGRRVLVVSRGDRELVDLGGVDAGHFPQDDDGRYLGHHPRDSEDAVAQLEALRKRGAELPRPAGDRLLVARPLRGASPSTCAIAIGAPTREVCTIFQPRRAAAPRASAGRRSDERQRPARRGRVRRAGRPRPGRGRSHVPPGASVLVVSKGDAALLELPGLAAAHFPQDGAGGYAGHHPHDSATAIAELEELRRRGAEYLVLPATARWWLDFYDGLRHDIWPPTATLVADVADACLIYGLGRPAQPRRGRRRDAAAGLGRAAPRLPGEPDRRRTRRLVVLEVDGGVAPRAGAAATQRARWSANGRGRPCAACASAALAGGAEYLVVPRDCRRMARRARRGRRRDRRRAAARSPTSATSAASSS